VIETATTKCLVTLQAALQLSVRRIEKLADFITVWPDHLDVVVAGAPPPNVRYSEWAHEALNILTCPRRT
jgi:hypothetical protein